MNRHGSPRARGLGCIGPSHPYAERRTALAYCPLSVRIIRRGEIVETTVALVLYHLDSKTYWRFGLGYPSHDILPGALLSIKSSNGGGLYAMTGGLRETAADTSQQGGWFMTPRMLSILCATGLAVEPPASGSAAPAAPTLMPVAPHYSAAPACANGCFFGSAPLDCGRAPL